MQAMDNAFPRLYGISEIAVVSHRPDGLAKIIVLATISPSDPAL